MKNLDIKPRHQSISTEQSPWYHISKMTPVVAASCLGKHINLYSVFNIDKDIYGIAILKSN